MYSCNGWETGLASKIPSFRCFHRFVAVNGSSNRGSWIPATSHARMRCQLCEKRLLVGERMQCVCERRERERKGNYGSIKIGRQRTLFVFSLSFLSYLLSCIPTHQHPSTATAVDAADAVSLLFLFSDQGYGGSYLIISYDTLAHLSYTQTLV